MSSRLIGGLALAATFAAGLVVAGCGGEDHLTKAAFIKQGDVICNSGDMQINKEARRYFAGLGLKKGQQPNPSQIATFARQTLVPGTQKQIDQLRDLNPPKSDQDKVNAIFDAAQQGIDEIKRDPSILTGDEEPAGFKKADALAKDYGFKVCGQRG